MLQPPRTTRTDTLVPYTTLFRSDAGIPLIQAVDADDVPIVTVTLASPTYDDYGLKRLADSVAERLRSTPGVSVVSVYGGRNREIDVAFDPVRLQAFSISLAEGRGALAASRSEARRVGKGCVSTCRARWSPSHETQKKQTPADDKG